MTKDDWKYTYEYMHRYGNQVVLAIKQRIRKDKLIDTGALLDSIEYHIKESGDPPKYFQVEFTIGDGVFKKGSGLPSEYGVYQDQGTIFIEPHYFFTAPIPGLTAEVFSKNIEKAMAKDIERFIAKELKATIKN